MDHQLVLSILKYAGIALVPIAAVWGLATTTTTTDENDQKRLTWHGHMAIAMAVAGAIISAAAYGFELSIAASERASAEITQAERRAFERDQREADRDAREKLDRLDLQGELRASELLRTQLAGQLRQAEAERNARLRDLQLASQVGAGTRSNLERTEVALVGIQRLLQPIENMQITVTVRASLNGVQHDLGGISGFRTILPTDPDYPTSVRNGAVYSFLQRKSARLHFALPRHGSFLGSNRTIDADSWIGGLNYVLIAAGPAFVYFRMQGVDNIIQYDLNQMLARMTRRDDTIVSVGDLRSSVLLIELDSRLPVSQRSIHESLRVHQVVLTFSHRRIVIDGENFMRAGTHGTEPLYGVSLARFIPE